MGDTLSLQKQSTYRLEDVQPDSKRFKHASSHPLSRIIDSTDKILTKSATRDLEVDIAFVSLVFFF